MDLYFSCCIFQHLPQRIFLVSEISFSTRGTGYLSWKEAPEEEVARVEGSGREEKGNWGERERADVGEGDSALLST